MATTIEVAVAQTRLAEIVSQASAGEEFLLVDHGKPMARLLAVETLKPRTPGLHPGNFVFSDDFDDPMHITSDPTQAELKPRVVGLHAGNIIYMSDDFDDPLFG